MLLLQLQRTSRQANRKERDEDGSIGGARQLGHAAI